MANIQDVSQDVQYRQMLDEAQAQLEAASLRKGEIPTDHPSLTSLIDAHNESLAQDTDMRKQYPDSGMLLKTTTIGHAYPPSSTPLADLEKITIKDLRLEEHHRGCYLLVRLAADPYRIMGVIGVIEDEEGNGTGLGVYQQVEEGSAGMGMRDSFWKGRVAVVKEPWFKALGAGGYGVRVDHPSDLIWLGEGDERIPGMWREERRRSAEEWKGEGNRFVGLKRWGEAIECYKSALTSSPTPSSAEIIHNNLALVHLKLQNYEAALASLNHIPDPASRSEKALYRGGLALHSLGLLQQSLDHFQLLLKKYPKSMIGALELARVEAHIQQQQTGKYNFKIMLEASKLDPPNIDCATYIGPIEIRPAEGKGRGLFTTKKVKAGELLLCEKAFVHGFGGTKGKPAGEVGVLMNLEREKITIGTHAGLIPKVYRKVTDNPSLGERFFELFSGGFEGITGCVDGRPVVDSFLIERIICLNIFGCPSRSSHDNFYFHAPPEDEAIDSSGLWLTASYINHSCIPNCQRTFIGDMMIIRAAQDLPANTQLVFKYSDSTSKQTINQVLQQTWGFKCSCALCLDNENLKSAKKIKKRDNLMLESLRPKAGLITEDFIDRFESTYLRPATEVPRYDLFNCLIPSIFELYEAFSKRDGKVTASQVAKYALRALEAVGFVIEGVNKKTGIPEVNKSLVIKQWGVPIPGMVQVWEVLFDVWMHLKPRFVLGVKEAWKKVYMYALSGEDETFDSEMFGKAVGEVKE